MEFKLVLSSSRDLEGFYQDAGLGVQGSGWFLFFSSVGFGVQGLELGSGFRQVYSEPRKVGTWFLEDECWDPLYFTLRP